MVEPLLHAGRAPSGGAIADYFRVAGTLFRRVPRSQAIVAVLPWPNLIEWDAAMVRVDIDELPNLGTQLAAEHQRQGVEGFLRRQRLCSEIWKRFLSPPGLFKTLRSELTAGKL